MYRTLKVRRPEEPVDRVETTADLIWLFVMTMFFLVLLVGLFSGSLWLVASMWENGYTVAIIATILGTAIGLLGIVLSEPLVVLSTKAKRLPDGHKLVLMTREVAQMANMRAPSRVYIIPEDASNACAIGLRFPLFGGGAIAFTRGIMYMPDRALRGVIGHELSHHRTYDLYLAAFAGALSAALGILLEIILRAPSLLGGSSSSGSSSRRSSSSSSSDSSSSSGAGCAAGCLVAILKFFLALIVAIIIIGVIIVVTQILIPLVKSFMNQQREYAADEGSALILGSVTPMIEALEWLEDNETRVAGAGGFANMFFSARARDEDGLDWLHKDHPDTDDRIARLRRRADKIANLG